MTTYGQMRKRLHGDLIVCRGGRTGAKLHLAHKTSSGLRCGRWIKAQAHHYEARIDNKADDEVCNNACEKCFG